MDVFGIGEMPLAAGPAHRLGADGGQTHFHALPFAIHVGDVLPLARIEVRPQQAVDVLQHIAVERRRHAHGIIIGCLQFGC